MIIHRVQKIILKMLNQNKQKIIIVQNKIIPTLFQKKVNTILNIKKKTKKLIYKNLMIMRIMKKIIFK